MKISEILDAVKKASNGDTKYVRITLEVSNESDGKLVKITGYLDGQLTFSSIKDAVAYFNSQADKPEDEELED